MSTTELDDVQALLERVLPDPTGFARRLLLQVTTQLGQFAEPGTSASYPRANAFYTAATTRDDTMAEAVITPDPPTADDMAIDTNMLLAAALGACECWGSLPSCQLCLGRGSAGWTQPDLELFEEFVQPAVARLSGLGVDRHDQHSSAEADEGDSHQNAKGDNT